MSLVTMYAVSMGSLLFTLYLFGFATRGGLTLFIDGCPMFGCRPSGSFSIYLQLAKENASVNWISDFVMDPVPNALGCVSDSVNIVCPSNGPFTEDKGYISLFTENGTLRWRDKELHYPTLPLLDNYGDVTGTDGEKLVHYDADGKHYPSIPCDGLVPIFNMAIVGDSFLLLVSANGMIVVRETNGVPVGSLTLNATYSGVNGTFLPIAQPVINKQRFYLLTEFVALDNENLHKLKARNRRLYAIDVHESISDRITIAWYVDFPYNYESATTKSDQNAKEATSIRSGVEKGINDFSQMTLSGNASLLWNRYNSTVYLITPDVNSNSQNSLFGIRDKGDEGEIAFNSRLDVSQIAMFVSDHCEYGSTCSSFDETKNFVTGSTLWAVTRNYEIHQISDQGTSVRTIDLKNVFDSSVAMTTKMSLVRNSDTDNDILLFGITMKGEKNNISTYIVAIDTATDGILWKVNVPDNMIPLGQITGVSGTDVREKDSIVVYAETPGKSAKIFSIN